MAYAEMAEVDDTALPDPGTVVSSTMAWIGAACSLALLSGVGWWGYDLATRDARGVPVIAALDGPARTRPPEPGGFEAAHQGLTVTDVSEGAAPALPDEVRLAPPPTTLAAEDRPVPTLRPAVEDDALRDAVNSALQDALLADDPAAAPEPARALPAIDSARPGTLRPRPRPAGGIVSRAAIVPVALVPQALDLDPGDIALGTPLVQLGAYDSVATARAEWDSISGVFGPFFEDRQRVIERAVVSGKTFYRLRVASFDDMAAARRFCTALTSQGTDCIPVRQR